MVFTICHHGFISTRLRYFTYYIIFMLELPTRHAEDAAKALDIDEPLDATLLEDLTKIHTDNVNSLQPHDL